MQWQSPKKSSKTRCRRISQSNIWTGNHKLHLHGPSGQDTLYAKQEKEMAETMRKMEKDATITRYKLMKVIADYQRKILCSQRKLSQNLTIHSFWKTGLSQQTFLLGLKHYIHSEWKLTAKLAIFMYCSFENSKGLWDTSRSLHDVFGGAIVT